MLAPAGWHSRLWTVLRTVSYIGHCPQRGQAQTRMTIESQIFLGCFSGVAPTISSFSPVVIGFRRRIQLLALLFAADSGNLFSTVNLGPRLELRSLLITTDYHSPFSCHLLGASGVRSTSACTSPTQGGFRKQVIRGWRPSTLLPCFSPCRQAWGGS